jgi:acetyl esterase/lipase
MLLCPGTDLTLEGGSIISNARKDAMLNEKIARSWVSMYLGDTDPKDPLASPAYANLEGLPPLYIQIGSGELLLDGARQTAEAAEECGVPVELEIFNEMFHVWQLFFNMIPEGRDAVDKLGNFCREKMAAGAAEREQAKTEIA